MTPIRRFALAVGLSAVLVTLIGYVLTPDPEWQTFQRQLQEWHTACDGAVKQPPARRTKRAQICIQNYGYLTQWAARKGWRGRY